MSYMSEGGMLETPLTSKRSKGVEGTITTLDKILKIMRQVSACYLVLDS